MTDAVRLPPHNIEAEQGVIGSIILDNAVLCDVLPIISPDDFYRDAHGLLYKTILGLYGAGQPIDAITLCDTLSRLGFLEKAGGLEYIAEVIQSVPHTLHAAHYAQIVHEKAIARRLIFGANDILREGYSNTKTSDELLDFAEQKIFEIHDDRDTESISLVGAVAPETLKRILARTESSHAITGLGTGFPELDEMTSGFQPNQLIIVAARPSMGKTAFALNIAEHVAIDSGSPVLFVSLEMGRHELTERLFCSQSMVDGKRIRSGKGVTWRDRLCLDHALDMVNSSALTIDDSASRTVLQVLATARRMKMRGGLALVVVDYIQLVNPDEGRDNRQEQIAKISRRLKTLARDIEVPVVALSQLNRAVETREDRRPRMADLRESGAIEQDADIVLLLHRPDYYEPDDQPGITELIVAKNRNGATGTIKMGFAKRHTRFLSFPPMTTT